MSFSERDAQEMLQEMGICSTCHNHIPCGCETVKSECIITERFDCPNDVISGKLCSSCKIPDNMVNCDVCGSDNSDIELLHNDGACFNCNTQLN